VNVPRGMRRDAPALRNVNPCARAHTLERTAIRVDLWGSRLRDSFLRAHLCSESTKLAARLECAFSRCASVFVYMCMSARELSDDA